MGGAVGGGVAAGRGWRRRPAELGFLGFRGWGCSMAGGGRGQGRAADGGADWASGGRRLFFFRERRDGEEEWIRGRRGLSLDG